ncbi:MAG: hypothetical protein AUF65_00545 [Chloroflexi bacterium 13_1_20CM_50_12]|nr:MAG: hypothetical protein AUF65_00545 [Chloroflexi bacterium 13_1_20CM_50_12]
MPPLSKIALRRLIELGETSTVELKVASPRPDEMAERLCGLANAQGGYVIVGVADESLEIVGVPDRKIALAKDVILRAARQMIKPSLLLDPPEPEVYVLDGKNLVVATAPANNGTIYQTGGVFWVRRGTHTVPLNLSEVVELAHGRGLVSWELQPARKATMVDIDVARVETYLHQRSGRSQGSGRFDDLEMVLVGMECAKVMPNGEIQPTNAGVLFFGNDPQQDIFQSEVVCVLFRDELGVGGYIDRKIIRGTIQELIDDTEAFFNKYMMVGAKIVGWKRIDLPEYPIEALREAAVNAVIHRDYSRVGESLRVFYYPDRVEIHSPGSLMPGISIEQMERGEVASRLRNPVLANLLRDIPGYMERIGSGIRLMLNETRRMGLPAPQFREVGGEFVVTFRKVAVGNEEQGDSSPKGGAVQQLTLDIPSTVETLQVPGREDLPRSEQRMMLALRHIQEHTTITSREYGELAGISESTALRDLEAWVERGVLKRIGKRRGRRYELA